MSDRASNIKLSDTNDLEVNPATSENQTNGNQKTQIVGDTGNIVEVNESGQLHTVMRGHLCIHNSTTTPLLADGEYTGEAEDILDYGGISVFVTSDVASAVNGLKIQYSSDGLTNWRTAESYTILAGVEKWFSPPAFGKYFRVSYTNGGTEQTFFELTTILRKTPFKWSSHNIDQPIKDEDDAELVKAVITGKKTNGDFDNASLTNGGNLKISLEEFENDISSNFNTQLNTSLFDFETGRGLNIESLGALKSITPTRLAGTAFSNGTKDPNFWTETVTGSGTVTQSGEITLCTGTTANSTARYRSIRKGRKVTGSTQQFRAVARNQEEVTADTIRRIGAYDDNDGFFMEFDGVTFGLGTRKGGVDTVITNGNFNGNAGATIDITGTDFLRIVFEFTSKSIKFFIDNILIHTISATTSNLTNTQDLNITMEIINENGNTTDNCFEVLFATIVRLGPLETENQYKYIGANGTNVLKYGAGRLERITNLDNSGNVSVYDDVTATAGKEIAVIDTAKALGTLEFGIPFNDGLTVVSALGAKITVVYE